MNEGRYTLPTYVFVAPEQRAALAALLSRREQELSDLLSELLAAELARHPDLPSEAAPAAPLPQGPERSLLLRQRRAELARLQARIAVADDPLPQWLTQYLSDLQAEIARLTATE